MKKRILTGDRPTGPLHLGHYVGSLQNRVRLQNEYDCYFIIADYQILTDHLYETQRVENNVKSIVLDWLSMGMNPEKSTFFIQSRIPAIAELMMYFSMMVTIPRLQRNPTVKEEFNTSHLRSMSYGFLGYPVSQAADILSVRAHLVPIGDDNLPHVEQTREIARFFNTTFANVFPIPEPLLGNVPRLPGLDGQKMGKSLGNAIYLNDSPQEIKQKVKAAITDPARIRVTDAGHPEVCVIFQYHLAVNQAESTNLGAFCRQGKIGCVECKQKAASKIITSLAPIGEKRLEYEGKLSIVRETLQAGIDKTIKESEATLALVREAMHFDYQTMFSST